MIKAWVCRKYSGNFEQNTLEALEVAREINAIDGWIAVVPHQLGRDIADTKTYDEWMSLCLSIANECDVLIVEGDASLSRGCLIERVDCCNHPQIERSLLPSIKAIWAHVEDYDAFLQSLSGGTSHADLRAMLKAIEQTEGDR